MSHGHTYDPSLALLHDIRKHASAGTTTDAELEQLKNLGGHARGDRAFEAAKKKKKKEMKQAAFEYGALAVMKTAGFATQDAAVAAYNIYE